MKNLFNKLFSINNETSDKAKFGAPNHENAEFLDFNKHNDFENLDESLREQRDFVDFSSNMNIDNAKCDMSNDFVFGNKIVALFDIDQTLMKGSSSYYVACDLYNRKFFGLRDIFFATRHVILYLLLGESKRRMNLVCDRALRVLAGRSVDEVSNIMQEIYDRDMKSKVFLYMKYVLQRHIKAGHDIWLVSAVPVQISDVIAKNLGAKGALGTKVKVVDGILQPELDGCFMHGEGKREAVLQLAVERGYDLSSSFAYGDSYQDMHMLSLVGFPCAVNPDRKLRKVCLARGWNILHVKRTNN